ncbi:MAG: hypothetical protein JO037_12745 [Actinobacteria bacterium]|nr:hypothetical protein [Actinomycetota bacterium]
MSASTTCRLPGGVGGSPPTEERWRTVVAWARFRSKKYRARSPTRRMTLRGQVIHLTEHGERLAAISEVRTNDLDSGESACGHVARSRRRRVGR